MPQALQTLARPTPPSPTSISKAERWIREGGWGFTGKETAQEKETLAEAYQEGVRFLASWMDGLDPYWLVLVGASGTGKTMLCKRIAEYHRKFGSSVWERTVVGRMKTDNIERVSYSYNQEGSSLVEWCNAVPHSGDNILRYERARSDWFKVIDDLKAQSGETVKIKDEEGVQPKAFEVRAAGDLLDSRLRKWTLINSNLTRKQLAIFWDVRIASRLMRDLNTMVDLSNVRDFAFRK